MASFSKILVVLLYIEGLAFWEAKILFQPCQVCKQWARKRKSHFVNSDKDLINIFSLPPHCIPSTFHTKIHFIWKQIYLPRFQQREYVSLSARLGNAMVIKLRKYGWEWANTHTCALGFAFSTGILKLATKDMRRTAENARATVRY